MHEGGPSENNPGECTLHTRNCGHGVGAYFLIQSYCVILMHDSRASFYPSLYLDVNGETDNSKGQNRPMFLSMKRKQKVEEIYKNHMIPYEVARNRATKDKVIRQWWY